MKSVEASGLISKVIGDTITLILPFRVRRRGGRKLVVTPDGLRFCADISQKRKYAPLPKWRTTNRRGTPQFLGSPTLTSAFNDITQRQLDLRHEIRSAKL